MTDDILADDRLWYPSVTCTVCGHFHARRKDGRIVGRRPDQHCTDCGYCRRGDYRGAPISHAEVLAIEAEAATMAAKEASDD